MSLFAGILSTFVSWAQSGLTLTVVPAVSPNPISGTYSAWAANAAYAQLHGLTSYGLLGTPEYYSRAGSTVIPGENIMSEFSSWHGQANPAAMFGSSFSSEMGNAVAFGLYIDGNGQTFDIEGLTLDVRFTGNMTYRDYFEGFSYDPYNIGLNYGGNGIKGDSDDYWITSGPSTQLVNEFHTAGFGSSWYAVSSGPGSTDQERLNAVFEGEVPFQIIGTYRLGDEIAQASITVVPEPSAYALWGMGLAVMTHVLRRRPKKTSH